MIVYAPDADPSQPGVIYAGSNLRPTVRGYANYFIPGLADDGVTTYSDTPTIMYGHQYATASARVLIGGNTGTVGKVYQLVGSTYTLADAYTTHWTVPAGGSNWTFTSFGEYVIVASPNTSTQFVQTAINTQFTAVAGSPACRSLCTFKNFVIAANCGTYGAVTGTPDMVAWSALGDHSSWVPNTATQAGYQQVYDPLGAVMYVKPIGDAVAIYKNTGIILMRGTGNPSTPFSFQRVAGAKGALGNVGGLVDIGDRHIFIGLDDIYIFDGATTRSITVGRVRDYLLTTYPGNVSTNVSALLPSQIQHDPIAGEVVFVTYKLVYNYRFDKWGHYDYTRASTDRAVAVCHSDTVHLNGIYFAPTLTLSTAGKFHQRLAPNEAFTGPPASYYSDMGIQVLGGDNGITTMLRRVVPRFAVVPAGTGTMAYYRRVIEGGPRSADGTGTWDGTNYRFDIAKTAYWHDLTLSFPSTAPMELLDLQFDFDKAGKRVEGQLR